MAIGGRIGVFEWCGSLLKGGGRNNANFGEPGVNPAQRSRFDLLHESVSAADEFYDHRNGIAATQAQRRKPSPMAVINQGVQ